MANVFFNIPVPPNNGAGAAVDVSTMGKNKSFVIGGAFKATVNVEYTTNAPGDNQWAPLATFHQSGNLTIDVACLFVRAVVTDYVSGAPNLDVGGNDAGTLFVQLLANSAAADVSALPAFKTVCVNDNWIGTVEASEDGVSWAQIMSFQAGTARGQSAVFNAQFCRIVPQGVLLPVVINGADDGGGGGGAASSLLSIYGDGSFGDYTTAGDETWNATLGAPGAPAVPAGSFFPYAFFNNLTISPGDSVAVGALSDTPLDKAVVIFVKETLTIGAGGRIHVNGGDGGGGTGLGGTGGLGRNAIFGSISGGANGGDGNPAFAAGPGQPGLGGSDRPALGSAARIGGVGGAGGTAGIQPGGAGGVDEIQPIWPYTLATAISIASIMIAVGGGNGGGGGGNSSSSAAGAGGGGAGTLVIFAKTIVAPAGSLQAIGGAGGPGFSTENVPGGGGGGGTGGMILVVTDNTTIAGIGTVAGGAGGLGAGVPQFDGAAGGPGEIIAINPMLAAQIPV